MAFTRDDLAAYEAKPQTQVPDNKHPLNPVNAQVDETAAADDTAAADADTSDADASDQTESGDDTSDETSESSTESAAETDGETEESEEADGESDETTKEGETSEEETTDDGKPRKQLSRAEKRIQALNAKAVEAGDLAEGYKEYGKMVSDQLKAANAEIARLRSSGEQPAGGEAPAGKVTKAEVQKLGPMPTLEDADVNFDPQVLATKQQAWFEKLADERAEAAVRKVTGQNAVAQVDQTFQARVTEFKKTHEDWDAKAQNKELVSLHPVAQAKLKGMELGPAIVYELMSNPKEANRIAALDAAEQLLEIADVRAQVKAKAAAAAKPADPKNPKPKTPVVPANGTKKVSVSKAPPPPSPTPGGRRANAREETDPGMDMDEFARRHREGKVSARKAAREAVRGR